MERHNHFIALSGGLSATGAFGQNRTFRNLLDSSHSAARLFQRPYVLATQTLGVIDMSRCMRFLLGIAGLAASSLCSAGASVEFKVVDQLIRQQPIIHGWLSSSLVLPDTAFAEVRFGSHFKHLSGGRMGPYTFRAKPRASSFAGDIVLIVCTGVRFLDKSGKQLPDSEFADAVRLEETLVSVQVRDGRADAGSPVCPE